MIKSFRFLVLGLIVSSGTGAFSAPVAETLTKSTTPTLDQTAQTSADGKRTFRAAVLNNEAFSENRAFVDPSAQLKDGGNRLISTLKKWTDVEFVMEKVQYRALKQKLREFILTHMKKLYDLIQRIRKAGMQRKFKRRVVRATSLINANVDLVTLFEKGITPNAHTFAQDILMKDPKMDAATRQQKEEQIGEYVRFYRRQLKLTKA
uniref:RxLR effector candidate protein n=1 Tax=Hyaloperonospora arabidopsidis (strain Emoy2) TaxID=559515 RepID=M4BXD4_HYAAE|nr:RxLR effector candidate protein [Hyaloperonospora arabidopsidis Emoy2]